MDVITQNTVVYYISFLVPIFAIFLLSSKYNVKLEKIVLNYLSIVYIGFIILLIGFRKIGPEGFTDTNMYMHWFHASKLDGVINTKDIGFGVLTYLLSYIVNVKVYFFLCTLLSFSLLIWTSYKVAKEKWFLMLLGIMVSLYFWNSEVFTIRQGLASNFMLAAIFSKNKYFKIVLSLLAVSFHQSFGLTALAFLIVSYYNKTKVILSAWIVMLIISSIFNNQILTLFSKVISSESFNYYLYTNEFSKLSFRWDVAFFSFIFMGIGLYNLKVKNLNTDKTYRLILNLYICTNIFLLILGKSNIMHRFAYLSWFLIPIIIFYPLFKTKFEFNYSKYLTWFLAMYAFIVMYTVLKIYSQDMKFVPATSISI